MNFERKDLLLYGITDRHYLTNSNPDSNQIDSLVQPSAVLYKAVEQALKGGITMLQLREKNMMIPELEKEALQIKELCHKYNVPFILDDNVELAIRIKADGVHVGQSDMEASKVRALIGNDMILGVTARNVQEAVLAEEAGADYLGSGAVFTTGTKSDAKPMPHNILQQICESVKIPVVAIGGITNDNILQLRGRGIAGAAVAAGIFACSDITEGTALLRQKLMTFI